jgi:hypothetical protein
MNPADSLLSKLQTGIENDGHAISRNDRTLDLWSGPLRQRITASKPYESNDISVTSIHIQTDLFRGPPPSEEIAKELIDLSHTGDVSAIFYDEKTGLYKLGTRLTLHKENYDWMNFFIIRTAFLQNSTALRMVFSFDAPKGLSVAESASPKGLNKDKYGGNLKEFTQAIRKAGASSASPWEGKELAFIKDILGDKASFETGIDEMKQLCATVKSNGITFKVLADADTKHPFWGHGLTIIIMCPDKKENSISPTRILTLNKDHCQPTEPRNATGFWLFAGGELAHFLFLPNALHQPALTHIVFLEKWALANAHLPSS